jgi:excinuclease UvrABC nuclease subunit
MKDAAGRVIYVGKAKNLRSRAGSYFLQAAENADRVLGHEIATSTYVECESEVDALLMESRLIKDVQPKYNKELKDDKTFPYLMITTREDFPAGRGDARAQRIAGSSCTARSPTPARLRGAVQVLQRIFKFRTCSWTSTKRRALAVVSPVPAGQHPAVHRAVQSADQQGGIPPRHQAAADVPGGAEGSLLAQMRAKCSTAAKELEVREAARCATRSTCSRRSTTAANSTRTRSPRCLHRPQEGPGRACAKC